MERREEAGDSRTEAIRALKWRLSDVVYRAMLADAAVVGDVHEVNLADVAVLIPLGACGDARGKRSDRRAIRA